MTNVNDIRRNIVAAMAALAVSSTVILGTVGPIDGSATDETVQLQAGSNDSSVLVGQLI